MNFGRRRRTRTILVRRSSAGAALLALALASCGERQSSEGFDPSSEDASAGQGSDNSLTGGPSSCDHPAQACPCSHAGDTAPCWTGPANMRGKGSCHDGTVTCTAKGEVLAWGACQGEEHDCGNGGTAGGGGNGGGNGGGGHEDAGDGGVGGGGTEDAHVQWLPPSYPCGAQNGGPSCGCVPGAVVACDEDCTGNVYCTFGSKTCLPDGTWGACHEGLVSGSTRCFVWGYGCCGNSTGCNGGNGLWVGDCGYAFTCPVTTPPMGRCSASAAGGAFGNSDWDVTCTCQ